MSFAGMDGRAVDPMRSPKRVRESVGESISELRKLQRLIRDELWDRLATAGFRPKTIAEMNDFSKRHVNRRIKQWREGKAQCQATLSDS